ncbi:MAG: YegS/Rv2252/BmrU family lipid kinase [Actinomycetota bacterium]|nr:YegS/Rv2252/BmrU family lipid kinase [Actinomycetota bacterium]
MSATIAILVNPTSGRSGSTAQAVQLIERLEASGSRVRTLVGQDGRQALDLCHQAVADGVDALVAVGGDGTAHLALQAVAGTGTPFCLVPTGTGNDLASCLGVTPHPLEAADAVLAGTTRPVDAARTDNGDWWACVLGAGFDSAVNDRANRMSWPRGRRRYDLAVLWELRTLRPVPFVVHLDGRRLEADAMLVAVGNVASYGGGMRVCPDADPTDGLLDVVIVGPLSRSAFLRIFPSVFKGTHLRHPAVTVHRAREVRLEAPSVTAYADGECLQRLPVTSTVVAGAVQMLGLPPRT